VIVRRKDAPSRSQLQSRGQSGKFLLDTSALLAFIEDEEGADQVEEAITQGDTVVPWPALLEVYYITLREKGQAEANLRYALLRQLPVDIRWEMDEPTLLTAGEIKAKHRISLADAMIAAYAIRNDAVLIHKDPEFETLASLLPMSPLPYKPTSDR
jgi:predicted nucleic acid-binding protein